MSVDCSECSMYYRHVYVKTTKTKKNIVLQTIAKLLINCPENKKYNSKNNNITGAFRNQFSPGYEI